MANKMKNELQLLEEKISRHPAFDTAYDWSPRDFELGPLLGEGFFGKVHIAREKITGLIVAIKVIFKSAIVEAQCEKQILREIEIQSHLKHPNILRLLTWFHNESRIYMVLEYAAQGELFKHLTDAPNGRFTESVAAKYFYQIADAVEYCHQNDVIHRDIKPENILVDFNGDLKLADFGWSVHAPSQKRKTVCGTLEYLAPEMIKREVYDTSVDNWCMGILLYEFLVGQTPFKGDTKQDTYKKIISLKLEYPDHVSEGAKDLISKLLLRFGTQRVSLSAAKSHPWVQQFKTAS